MDNDKTDQRRDPETGHWVSDLKPGASTEAKVDKGVEDTFPASDPVQKAGVTGFILPDGEDTAELTRAGAKPLGTADQARSAAGQVSAHADDVIRRTDSVRAAAAAAVNQRPLAALLVAGAIGWMVGLLANSRR